MVQYSRDSKPKLRFQSTKQLSSSNACLYVSCLDIFWYLCWFIVLKGIIIAHTVCLWNGIQIYSSPGVTSFKALNSVWKARLYICETWIEPQTCQVEGCLRAASDSGTFYLPKHNWIAAAEQFYDIRYLSFVLSVWSSSETERMNFTNAIAWLQYLSYRTTSKQSNS